MTDLKIVKVIHYTAVAALIGAAAKGLNAYFANALDPLAGKTIALCLALCVGGLLSVSVYRWRTTGSRTALAMAALFAVFSLGISLPLWFTWLRGDLVVASTVEQRREEGLRQIIRLHDALVGLAGQAEALATYSANRAQEELKQGRTCEEIGAGDGPRQRFRIADANRFAETHRIVSAVADRVKEARSRIEQLPRITATNFPDVVRAGNEAFAVAGAASSDAVLRSMADMLRERARTDGDERTDPGAKRPFRCPDPQIAGSAARMAALVAGLPAIDATITMPDLRDPRTSAVELPGRILRSLRGEPGGLESTDWSALGIGVFIEVMVFASGILAHQRRRGLRLGEWNGDAFQNPEAVEMFMNVLEHSLPHLEAFIDALERYHLRLFMISVVLVSHGCADQRPRQLARVLPCLAALGLAGRDRRLPGGLLALVGWLRWKETRDASRREGYWVDRDALDELRLAAAMMWRRRAEQSAAHPGASPAGVQRLPSRWSVGAAE
jgi:hypothetical protein